MYASSPPGETTKRDLTADDIEGVCYVYPYGRDTPGSPGRTSSGLTAPTLTGEGCAVAAESAASRSTDARGWSFALMAIALALVRRFRK
jgi:MYXO-CTERM domain-containing protein